MTLVELMVVAAIFSFVALITSTLILTMYKTSKNQERMAAVSDVAKEVSVQLRGPQQILANLLGTNPCLKSSAILGNASASGAQVKCRTTSGFVPFQAGGKEETLPNGKTVNSGRAMTGSTGLGCLNEDGSFCAVATGGACSSTCPISLKTDYRIFCQAGTTKKEGECSPNEATVFLKYELFPTPGISESKSFLARKNTFLIQPSMLLTAQGDASSKVTAIDLNIGAENVKYECGAGEIMLGIRSTGDPLCQSLIGTDQRCGPGTFLFGYSVETNSNSRTSALKANCIPAVCNPLAGKDPHANHAAGQCDQGSQPGSEPSVGLPRRVRSTEA